MLISRNLILQGFLKSGSKSCKPEVTFAIHLGALEVIDNARMMVLYLSGYLLFQVIAGIVIFNKLMKKY